MAGPDVGTLESVVVVPELEVGAYESVEAVLGGSEVDSEGAAVEPPFVVGVVVVSFASLGAVGALESVVAVSELVGAFEFVGAVLGESEGNCEGAVVSPLAGACVGPEVAVSAFEESVGGAVSASVGACVGPGVVSLLAGAVVVVVDSAVVGAGSAVELPNTLVGAVVGGHV